MNYQETEKNMKLYTKFIVLPLLLIALSCNAEDNTSINNSTVKKLMAHYFGDTAKIIKNNDNPFNYYLTGDFNGNGLTDIVVVFQPKGIPEENEQVKIYKPWNQFYEDGFFKKNKSIHTSLVIFNANSDENWFSKNTTIFVQLAFSGELEAAPSKASIMIKGSNEHNDSRNYLPKNATNDIIIIPSDAAIDTYFYWDKDFYKFYVTNEMP